jgi:hypothetical protein
MSASASPSPSAGYTAYTRGNYASLPANDADLETAYSEAEVTKLGTKDDDRVAQASTAGQTYVIHQFKDFAGSLISRTLECELQSSIAPLYATVYLQIYNQVTATWETIDTNSSSAADTDFILIGDVANLTNYKNASNVVSCRVWQKRP